MPSVNCDSATSRRGKSALGGRSFPLQPEASDRRGPRSTVGRESASCHGESVTQKEGLKLQVGGCSTRRTRSNSHTPTPSTTKPQPLRPLPSLPVRGLWPPPMHLRAGPHWFTARNVGRVPASTGFVATSDVPVTEPADAVHDAATP
jgi:hypothetical protein